jgi:hypothetical protein
LNKKWSVNKKGEPQFIVDYQDVKQVQKKNMFTSSTGQLLLKDLFGPEVAYAPQNYPASRHAQTESAKNFCFNIPIVSSIEVNDAV